MAGGGGGRGLQESQVRICRDKKPKGTDTAGRGLPQKQGRGIEGTGRRGGRVGGLGYRNSKVGWGVVTKKQGFTDSTQGVAWMARMGAQRRLVSNKDKPQAEAWRLAVSNAGTPPYHHLHKQLFCTRILQHPACCNFICPDLPRCQPPSLSPPLDPTPPPTPPPPPPHGTSRNKHVVLEASPNVGRKLPDRMGVAAVSLHDSVVYDSPVCDV